MKRFLITARNRLIGWLAGNSTVVVNCDFDGEIHVSRPHSFIQNARRMKPAAV